MPTNGSVDSTPSTIEKKTTQDSTGDADSTDQQSGEQCDGDEEKEEQPSKEDDERESDEATVPTTDDENTAECKAEDITASQKSDSVKSEEVKTNLAIQARLRNHPYGPKPDLLSTNLDDPVPSHWKTLETEFVGIAPLMVPCMAHGFYGDPNLPIGSGSIRILIMENSLKRMGLFGLLNGTESGKHIGMDGLQLLDVKAYRLEPLTAPGLMTIDGEEIFYGPHQVQIHPGLGRIMCRLKRKL